MDAKMVQGVHVEAKPQADGSIRFIAGRDMFVWKFGELRTSKGKSANYYFAQAVIEAFGLSK